MTAVSSEHLKHLWMLLNRYEYDKAYALLAGISEEIKSNHDYIPDEVRRFFCSVCDLFGQINRNYPQEARENPFGEIYRNPPAEGHHFTGQGLLSPGGETQIVFKQY
jgi:hypothetical protein